MVASVSEIINKLVFNNSSEDKNIYVYSENKLNSLDDLKQNLDLDNELFYRDEEVLLKSYFSPKLSIQNNINFICTLHNKNKKKFIKDHYLVKNFNRYKDTKAKSISAVDLNLFMLCLYLYTNESYLISLNLSKTFDVISPIERKKIMKYLKRNQLIYFASNYQKSILKREIFSNFLVLSGNDYKIFDNLEEFRSYTVK